jgi:hypothetical protein
MLDVGLALTVRSREVDAGLRRDESLEVFGNFRPPAAALLEARKAARDPLRS